jgi:hypothetical protein
VWLPLGIGEQHDDAVDQPDRLLLVAFTGRTELACAQLTIGETITSKRRGSLSD